MTTQSVEALSLSGPPASAWRSGSCFVSLRPMGLAVETPTISFQEKLAIVLISAVLHHVVYLGSGKLFAKFFRAYNFTYSDQRSWRSRCTSLVHALMVGALGAYVMFVERKLDMEAVWPATNLSTITMAISTGYFLWDSIVVLVRYDLFGFLFALHGIYCLYVYAAASFYMVYHYHALALLMFEWSTPAMNIFFMADQVETKMEEAAHPENRIMTRSAQAEADKLGAPAWFKKTTFILSGIFALNFFVVRILWGHYHYYHFYRVCWKLWYETPAWFNISLMALIVVAFLLNGTWMVQIILTGLGVVKKPDANTRPLPKATEDIHVPIPSLLHHDEDEKSAKIETAGDGATAKPSKRDVESPFGTRSRKTKK